MTTRGIRSISVNCGIGYPAETRLEENDVIAMIATITAQMRL